MFSNVTDEFIKAAEDEPPPMPETEEEQEPPVLPQGQESKPDPETLPENKLPDGV